MNAPISLVGGAPRFSTDPIALSVNRFIARRTALTSRPDTKTENTLRRASAPLEVLYPSLYVERIAPPAWWRAYVRAAAAVFAPRIRSRPIPGVLSDEALPAAR